MGGVEHRGSGEEAVNASATTSQETSLDRVIRYGVAIIIIESLLFFLYLALLSLDTAALSESAEGIIVGGFVSIISIIVTSLFQGIATGAAVRQAVQATQAGANAALTMPGTTTTIDEGPPTVVTTGPSPAVDGGSPTG